MNIYNYSNPSEYKNLEDYQKTMVSIHPVYYKQKQENVLVKNASVSGNIIHYQGNSNIITSLQNISYPSIAKNEYHSEGLYLEMLIDKVKLLLNYNNDHIFRYSKLILSPTENRKYLIIGTLSEIFIVEITEPEINASVSTSYLCLFRK